MRFITYTVIILLLLAPTGCNTFSKLFRRNPKATPLIPMSDQTPTLEQLTSAINRNSQTIRCFSTENASLLVPGVLIPLHSRISFERNKRLRIQSFATTLGGQELDFGSNETLFWLWARRLEKEMYYCEHSKFPLCPVKQLVPIEPDWVIEALGVAEFSPNEQHEGPIKLDDGNLAIITRRQSASGLFIKRTILDGKTAWILRQEMYNPQNQLIALAVSSDHCYDKGSGIHYARKTEVQCQGTEGKLVIDLGTPVFNNSVPFNSATFTMPSFDGYKAVDICGQEFLQNRGIVMPAAQPGEPATVFPAPQPVPQPVPQPAFPAVPTAETSVRTVIR
jgi:hypothetical protein